MTFYQKSRNRIFDGNMTISQQDIWGEDIRTHIDEICANQKRKVH